MRWPRIWSCSSHRLRACDTKGRTFGGQGRGGRLTDHATWVEECLQRSEDLVDTVALRQLWDRFRGLPREDADAMCHTDLIPGNLLTRAGRLTGVLDTGGFQPADPALDLVCGWHLLGSPARQVLRRDLGCSDLQWRRGQAWAFEQAIGLVWYYQHTNVTYGVAGPYHPRTAGHRGLSRSLRRRHRSFRSPRLNSTSASSPATV